MQKSVLMLVSVILIVSLLSVSFVSASWFSDLWSKITGNAINNSANKSCTDSDGGDNQYVKGTLNLKGKNYTDFCDKKGKKLTEYYCNSKRNKKDKIYVCKDGCENEACVNNQINKCNQNKFSMAFILVANSSSEITSERINKLINMKNLFSQAFYLATNGLATMNTSYPIKTFTLNQLNNDTSVQNIARHFYINNPDNFDFISILAVNGFSQRQTSHESAQNKITGIGFYLFNNTNEFGSRGRLLGINYEKDIDILSSYGSLLHETGHQWCCFVGDNFSPDEGSSLGIIQESIHFFSGLESPYQCGTPMGAKYWVANGDGTFRNSKDCLEPEKYHPFQLYFMGLYNSSNFDFNKKFNIYYASLDMNSKAYPYKQVSINDIISVEGNRKCSDNISIVPPKS